MESEEIWGLVLAVMGIVLLGFFAFKLFNFFVDADMKKAQTFIDDLAGKIDTLKDGESNTFALRGVSDWVLVGWNKNVDVALEGQTIGKDLKPQKCFDKNCICLCEKSITKCQEVGYCREIDRNVNLVSKIDYTFVGDNSAFRVKVASSCIPQYNQLMAFSVDKKTNEINILHDYGIQTYQSEEEKNKILTSLSTADSTIGKLEGACLLSQEVVSRG